MDKFQRPKSSLAKSVDKHHKSVDKRLPTKENYCCPIKILQKTKNRADFICEVSPFSLDFRRQTNQSNYGQKYTF